MSDFHKAQDLINKNLCKDWTPARNKKGTIAKKIIPGMQAFCYSCISPSPWDARLCINCGRWLRHIPQGSASRKHRNVKGWLKRIE